MKGQENVGVLAEEYRMLINNQDTENNNLFEEALIQEAEWTPLAAEHLVSLAKNYGSFMLRNALAISLALEIEDGYFDF